MTAVAIKCLIDDKSVCFLSCHLAAHTTAWNLRNQEFHKIKDGLLFGLRDHVNIMDLDQVFWIGDLNYRIHGLEREAVIRCLEKNELQALLQQDQLRIDMGRMSRPAFEGFSEGEITFMPTFKYDVGTSE